MEKLRIKKVTMVYDDNSADWNLDIVLADGKKLFLSIDGDPVCENDPDDEDGTMIDPPVRHFTSGAYDKDGGSYSVFWATQPEFYEREYSVMGAFYDKDEAEHWSWASKDDDSQACDWGSPCKIIKW